MNISMYNPHIMKFEALIMKAFECHDPETMLILADKCDEKELLSVAKAFREEKDTHQYPWLCQLAGMVMLKTERPKLPSLLTWLKSNRNVLNIHEFNAVRPKALQDLLKFRSYMSHPERFEFWRNANNIYLFEENGRPCNYGPMLAYNEELKEWKDYK